MLEFAGINWNATFETMWLNFLLELLWLLPPPLLMLVVHLKKFRKGKSGSYLAARIPLSSPTLWILVLQNRMSGSLICS